MIPVIPPKRKVIKKPITHRRGVSKVIEPCHIVPIQLKNFTPVGTPIIIVMNEKNGNITAPVTYMW